MSADGTGAAAPAPAQGPAVVPPPGTVLLAAVHGVPEVRVGDDLAALLADALGALGGLLDGDVLAVSSKVVSKALGLREPAPGDPGADPDDRDPGPDPGAGERDRREAAVARHTVRVVAERATPHGTTRVVEALAGPVMAAAGVDASNTGPDGGLLLLPADPDAAARELHAALAALHPGVRFGVLLTDTAGRAWRSGQTDLALGAHDVRVLDDLRGGVDVDGRPLAVTARALGDELAAAADLVKGKLEGVPAALLRGLDGAVDPQGPGARTLVRTGPGDWFATGHREAVRAALGAAPGSPQSLEVGLPSVGPEEEDVRGARAVRLALLGQRGEVQVSGSAATGYAVRSPDPVTAGRVSARLEVALAGEDLTCPVAVELRPAHEAGPLSDRRRAGGSAGPCGDPAAGASPR